MKKFVCVIFCMFFALSLASCQACPNEDSGYITMNTEPTVSQPIASFDSINDFKISLKKDPNAYVGKLISIKGYTNKLTFSVFLFDNPTQGSEVINGRPRLKIDITDNVLFTVVGDCDYIEVYGVVSIADGEIYLADCTYTMITPREEQN